YLLSSPLYPANQGMLEVDPTGPHPPLPVRFGSASGLHLPVSHRSRPGKLRSSQLLSRPRQGIFRPASHLAVVLSSPPAHSTSCGGPLPPARVGACSRSWQLRLCRARQWTP